MRIQGRLTGFSLNRDGSQNITITTSANFGATYDELKDGPIEFEIKKARKHRSLDANAYAWVLIDRIATVMNMSKTFVYRMAIREIGGVSETVCAMTEDVPRITRWWESKGLGWQVDAFPSKIAGCTNLTLYCGSSAYESDQMARLIDSLIQEAEGLGIPTITPKEEEEMLSMWGKKRDGKRSEPASA